MGKVHKKKKKRSQPRPKAKKHIVKPVHRLNPNVSFEDKMRVCGHMVMKALKNKEQINQQIQEHVKIVEGYFKKYDTLQLLGSTGLYLMDNLANLEKFYLAQISGKKLELDERAEVISEYALNFGLSMPNDGKEEPSNEVVLDLRERLRSLSEIYGLLDMPLDNDAEQFINWLIHSETVIVRGDAYPVHYNEVFYEMFMPHSDFYKERYGFSVEELRLFFADLENRIICKIGDQDSIYGIYKMWVRWKNWEDKNHGSPDDDNFMEKHDFSKGIFGEFFESNPDVPHDDNNERFVVYPPDFYQGSDRIFWIYPQSAAELNIMKALSLEFGDNPSFIENDKYKGNIMNGHSIFERPFVKDGDKYYCFAPMIPHRNAFLIAEKLMMRDQEYYNKHFQQNTELSSRDKYIEKKVRSVLESFLPSVTFYSSTNYNFIADGQRKRAELDLLGISDKATYVIEVKAHELSRKDRVGLDGAKYKFRQSVGDACSQCNRATKHIIEDSPASFSEIIVDNNKPIYKIAVTFTHYSALIGNIDVLIKTGLLGEEDRDTWIVSLFDLMVFADFITSEEEFMSYLDMHKIIYSNHSMYNDELDLLSGFLNDDLAKKVSPQKKLIIMGGSELIDEEYEKDYKLPFEQ